MLSTGIGTGATARRRADMPWFSWGLYQEGSWGKDNKEANGKHRIFTPGSRSLSSSHGLPLNSDILPDTPVSWVLAASYSISAT